MSLEDDYNDFMKDNEQKPEDVFSICTLMPSRKIKVIAHLEDQDGEQLLVSEVAENLVKYINDQMKMLDSTPVNSQLFPMCGQFMTSIVPRFIGIPIAGLMFESGAFRHGVLTFGLASMLFIQYIQQHNLRIVTTTVDLTDEEVETYLEKSKQGDTKIRDALSTALGIELPNEDKEDEES